MAKLERTSTDPGEPEDPADEWPEYKQPTGAHDAYHVGDKITYNGKHYTCIYDGCVRKREPHLHWCFQVVDWCCSFRAMV